MPALFTIQSARMPYKKSNKYLNEFQQKSQGIVNY